MTDRIPGGDTRRPRHISRSLTLIILLLGLSLHLLPVAVSQGTPTPSAETIRVPLIPPISISIGDDDSGSPANFVSSIQILLILTVLSLAPGILMMMTSFTRIVIVLTLLKQALGTQQMPPRQIIVGLALFLTMFVMTPVWNTINETALQPYLQNEITQPEAFTLALAPVRAFMFRQVRQRDLALMVRLSERPNPENESEVPTTVLVPAFMISELKTAFQLAFLVYLPFVVVDLVVASSLMSVGVIMLPPMMISLPLKLLLFVLADGWSLLVQNLVTGFR